MTTFVEFSIQPLPEIQAERASDAEVSGLLLKMFHLEIPGFVLRGAGVGYMPFPGYRLPLPNSVVELGNCGAAFPTTSDDRVATGLHGDVNSWASEDGETIRPFDGHFTVYGSAQVSMFRARADLTDVEVRQYYSDNKQRDNKRYMAGQVNPEIVEPVCHRITVQGRDWLGFTDSHHPHIFEDKTNRRSEIGTFGARLANS